MSQPVTNRHLADRQLDTLDQHELAAMITITRILQQLSPISRYKVETQIQLESAAREEEYGLPPNEEDAAALAAWEQRVSAGDAKYRAN